MAGQLKNGNKDHDLTAEEQRAGGIRSGEVRREKATMKKTLEMILNSTNPKGEKYENLVTLGLIANAINKTKGGNPEAYKTIAKMLGEYETAEKDEALNKLDKLLEAQGNAYLD